MNVIPLIFFLFVTGNINPAPKNHIEFDFNENRVGLSNFSAGGWVISGDLSCQTKLSGGSLIMNIKGKDIVVNEKKISWIDVRLVKRGSKLFINYIRSPQILIKGSWDLQSQAVSLDMITTSCDFDFLKGEISAKIKVYGTAGDLIVSGTAIVKGGSYQGQAFSQATLIFYGKPPLLHITDSEVILDDGTILEINGARMINLADLSNLFPRAQFVPRKVSLGGWEVLSQQDKKVELKKKLDGKVDVLLSTYDDDDAMKEAGAEVRYKMRENEFLRFRMQEDATIVGFERRHEF